jgi:elongation factor 1-gamma
MKIYNNRLGNIWTDLPFIVSNFAKIHLDEVMVEDTKSKEYKAKSFTGKCPALETPEGILVESAAIARYIAEIGEGKLQGGNAWESANVNMWIDFSKTSLQPHFATIIYAVFGHVAGDADQFNNAIKEVKEVVKTINVHLQGKTHLVANRVTVADIALALILIPLYQTTLDGGFRKAMPNVTNWLESLIKLPEFVSRLGNVKFTQKAIKPLLAEKKEEVKAPAPKPVAKPKATDDGEEEVEKKSGKNPLDLLPPTKFILPEFKSYFVNLGDKKPTEGMERFWKDYDPEGYTIYFVQYERYDDQDNVEDYKAKNFLNMFIQRCQDKLRPYTFSNTVVAQEPNGKFFEVQGVWLFRGKGVPAEMLEHD